MTATNSIAPVQQSARGGAGVSANLLTLERRVLILAPTANDGRMTMDFLNRVNIRAEACPAIADFCGKIEEGCGSLIIAEEALSSASLPVLLKSLSLQPSWSDLPVIILVSRESSSDDRLRRLKMFGLPSPAMLIERPIHQATLLAAVEVATRARDRQYQVRDLLEESRAASERLEKAVADRTAQLRATIGELEAFSYSVSHDLRSPLRAMQGYADALLDDYKDKLDPGGQEYLERIRRSAKRMDLLVQDILAYSRVAKGEIELQEIDFENVVRDVMQGYPALQEDCCDIHFVTSIPKVLGHEAYLTQIISNFLGNAVKFVATGTRPVINIRAIPEGEMVRISFEDNGIGISPEHQKLIFQIFGRVYADKKFEGTGIGLAIAKKAAERMGGAVGVNSKLGKGSQFYVLLKRAL